MNPNPHAGIAGRVRAWWLTLIAGEAEGWPPELVSKMRLLEGMLPLVAFPLGLRGVKTIADLLPDDDETMGALLTILHRWTGAMLEAPADDDRPGEGPAPGGTLGAGRPRGGEGEA